MNLRYPNITGKTPAEQIGQLKSFLYTLVEQLNLETDTGTAVIKRGVEGTAPYSGSETEQTVTARENFNQIKSLIIKSADIVNAYYEEINKKLEGVYVAQSDFGTYSAEVSQKITENAEEITRAFSSLQEISGALAQIIGTNAYIRQGLLFAVGDETLEEELGQALADGTGVYGVEVGQTTSVDGEEVFCKFARFTAYGMTLYDSNGKLSAYITDSRLNIPNAAVKNSLTRGGFVETVNADGSSVERWVGV